MGRAFPYIVLVVVGVALLLGAADISTRTSTCMSCHAQEAEFARWMEARLAQEQRGFSHELIACAACHMEGAAEGTIASGFRGLLHAATYAVPQIDPRRPMVSGLFKTVHVPSENCKYCHLAAITRKAVWLRDLHPRLKEIGLQMDHRKHVVAREGTCAKCHERYKDKKEGADKEVNYAEVNHLSCASCHSGASHAYRSGKRFPLTQAQFVEAREETWKRLAKNPRWMIALPTEQSCRRCHNGKIHYKTRIFPVACDTGTNYNDCIKCHPLMTKEYFKKHRKERRDVKTAALEDGPMVKAEER